MVIFLKLADNGLSGCSRVVRHPRALIGCGVGPKDTVDEVLSSCCQSFTFSMLSDRMMCPWKEILSSTGIFRERSTCTQRASHHESWTEDGRHLFLRISMTDVTTKIYSRTKPIIRKIMRVLHKPVPGGLCGMDDNGYLTGWYVFSAMGFYPVEPSKGVYVIGSPAFRKVTV